MLILADSGILLRLMERADPQHGTIRTAVRVLMARVDELVTATQNVAEFWNVCTRPATARGGLGLSVAETDHRLRVLERLVQLIADLPTVSTEIQTIRGFWRHEGESYREAALPTRLRGRGVRPLAVGAGPSSQSLRSNGSSSDRNPR